MVVADARSGSRGVPGEFAHLKRNADLLRVHLGGWPNWQTAAQTAPGVPPAGDHIVNQPGIWPTASCRAPAGMPHPP